MSGTVAPAGGTQVGPVSGPADAAVRDDVRRALAVVEAAGGYRVLRRVSDWPLSRPEADSRRDLVGVAVVLDLETTGLDVMACDVIELAMAAVEYDRLTGRVLRATGRLAALQQPSRPIPAEVVRLTGINDAEVAGCRIASADVARFVEQADLIVAHNSGFDRMVAERHWPVLATKDWGCSLREIDWVSEGYDGGKLGHLLLQAGGYRTGHRAADDVASLQHLLSLPLPSTGRTGLGALLERVGRPTVRVWASGAPFDRKDALRLRGYRWSDGVGGKPRAWWREVAEAELGTEIDYLRRDVLTDRHASPPMRLLTARDRFSPRADWPDGWPCRPAREGSRWDAPSARQPRAPASE